MQMFNELSKGIIDIYYAQVLELGPGITRKILSILDEREKYVYNRYLLAQKKVEFLVGRYMLKNLLAYLLGRKPGSIYFNQNKYGKLCLEDTLQDKRQGKIEFNLSHSHGMVACAVVLEHEVGIDTERLDGNLLDVAKRVFAPGEVEYIFNHEERFQNDVAYRIWTLKEAYIKAKGIGLSMDLRSFNVLKVEEMFFETIRQKPDFYLSVAVKKNGESQFKSRVKEHSCIEIK